jgi:Plasmid encoded RepA protein
MAIEDNKAKGMQRAGDLLPAIIKPEHKPLSRIQERLVSMPLLDEEAQSILYQHSVLCQTCMPYRDPGEAVRLWQRRNGIVRLELQAGRLLDPTTDDFVDVGLPFGPKPRLVLYHLNAEALRTQTPYIELDDSLTAFVKRTLGLDVGGRTIKTVKEQLNRLAAADFRLGASKDGRSITIKGTVIEGLELWTPKDARQRVLWPTHVQFSARYFESLMQHAVPLNESAVSRLSHSAMGLDIYTWLAQRLHRVDPSKAAFVPWVSLKEQFGHGYARMDNFKRVFRTTLKQVAAVYREAKFSFDGRGIRLLHSRPPVTRRLLQVK